MIGKFHSSGSYLTRRWNKKKISSLWNAHREDVLFYGAAGAVWFIQSAPCRRTRRDNRPSLPAGRYPRGRHGGFLPSGSRSSWFPVWEWVISVFFYESCEIRMEICLEDAVYTFGCIYRVWIFNINGVLEFFLITKHYFSPSQELLWAISPWIRSSIICFLLKMTFTCHSKLL